MRVLTMAAAVALGLCSMSMPAQMGKMQCAPAPGSMMAPAKALDDMLSLFEGEVVPAAKAMPADKYNFAPSAAAFAAGSTVKFETVRSFREQVLHLAQANYFFYSTISGQKPDVDVRAIAKITTKEEAVKALEGSFAYAHRAIATITMANAFAEIKGADGMKTRATVAAFGVAHGFDHYGQMVEYLRMNGIVPPASAK